MSMKNKKKIIITGAAGLVGMNLLTKIDSKKYDVIAIDKNKDNLKLIEKINPQVKIFCFDLSIKNKKWQRLFNNADCVIQLQAQISSPNKELYIKNNIISVKNIVETCEKYHVKNLIHISSSVVISVAKDNYTKTKTKGEEIVKNSKVPHTILRPPLMYGCFDIKHTGFLVMLLDKSPVFPCPGNGKYIRQPLYVLDLVEIILKLIEKKPQNKIYNVIGKEKIYFIDMVKIIAKAEKRKFLVINIPIKLFNLLLKIYSFLFKKTPFVKEQLTALTAGDIFPLENWEKNLKVKYTSFTKGVSEMIRSPYYKYRYLMKKD